MDLSVNVTALPGLSNSLGRQATELDAAARYLAETSVLAAGAGLINELRGVHERLIGQVCAFLRLVSVDFAGEYALRIDEAVRSYQSTDHRSAADLDALFPAGLDPGGASVTADLSATAGVFDDPPAYAFEPPPDYRAEYPYQPQWYDALSVADGPRDVIYEASRLAVWVGLIDRPIDPFEAFTAPLCGDWAGLERTSFALCQVATALIHIRGRVLAGADTIPRVWSGHAANSCREVLTGFGHDLWPVEDLIVKLAASYHGAAVQIRELSAELDAAVGLLIDVAATGGVGAIEMGAEALVDVAEAEEAVMPMVNAMRTAFEVMHVLVAVVEKGGEALSGLGQQFGTLTDMDFNPTMPATMPTLPAVTRHRWGGATVGARAV